MEQVQAGEQAKVTEKGRGAAEVTLPNEVKKALKGLLFRDVQGVPALDVDRKPLRKNGKPVMAYHPHLRPMAPGDVLAYTHGNGCVIIVSRDGMKHRVEGT